MITSLMLARRITLRQPLNPANSFPPIGLQPLVSSCPSFCEPRPLFSIACSLFLQNAGGGVGIPNTGTSAPGLRFRRHMRHVAPLSPVASVDCAYFLSPRGCTHNAFRLQTTPSDRRSPHQISVTGLAYDECHLVSEEFPAH